MNHQMNVTNTCNLQKNNQRDNNNTNEINNNNGSGGGEHVDDDDNDDHDHDNNDDHDIINEVMIIAKAFQQAHDEDTMHVMNIQSSKKEVDIVQLFFYIIPSDWMHRAWPILHGQIPTTTTSTSTTKLGLNWREDRIGRIENHSLLAATTTGPTAITNNNNNHNALVSNSSSDNELDNNNTITKPSHQQSQKQDLLSEIHNNNNSSCNNTIGSSSNNPSSIHLLQNRLLLKQKQQQQVMKLRHDVTLYKDYFLVGSNVWFLLKQKFGYDIEIKCKCELLLLSNNSKKIIATKTTEDEVMNDNNNDTTTTTHYLTVLVPQEKFMKQNNNNNNTNANNSLLIGGEKKQEDSTLLLLPGYYVVAPESTTTVSSSTSESLLSAAVSYYPIPPTGRFRYEDYLSTSTTTTTTATSTNVDTESKKTTNTIMMNINPVSNNNNHCNNLTNHPQNQQQQPLPPIMYGVPAALPLIVPQHQHRRSNPGNGNNVSDDDDDDDEDDDNNNINDKKLFYESQPTHSGSDENLTKVSMNLPQSAGLEPSPILLLPPSTTAIRRSSRNDNDNFKGTSTANNSSDDYWLQLNDENDTNTNNTNNNTSAAGRMEEEYEYDDDDDKASSSDILSGSAVAVAISPPRRLQYGSGLGNLGNTCFMNSTLQCLAHTEQLQKYFLSGEYMNDLNRDNPLGSGGELAIQFARLLREMYIVEPPRPMFNASNTRTTRYSSSYASSMDLTTTSNVVYPRNFKNTLGRHAEQFMGYDQHDSQELATYLLDALHEDTNRVTAKPYVEKPEQAENETDEEAARKAWALHLKREDSRVLENFMGLVKSRVECCEPGCGRVSTTFDPFMYLSVPIPGSSEKTLSVTYVPCEPTERPKALSISILKTATIEELLKKVRDQVQEQFPTIEAATVPLEDLCPTDIWQKEVSTYFTLKEEVDKIRESDMTFVYELRSVKEIRRRFEQKQNKNNDRIISGDNSSISFEDYNDQEGNDEGDAERLGMAVGNRVKYYKPDVATLIKLNRGEEWSNRFIDYLRSPLGFINAFNPKKGSTQDRVSMYRQLIRFLDLCYKEAEAAASPYADENAATGQKRTREDNSTDESSRVGRPIVVSPDDMSIPDVEDRCSSSIFNNVKSRYDLAVLEFLAGKMRKEILDLERRQKQLYPDGIVIEVCMRCIENYPGEKKDNLSAPFVLRIPSDMTVYELRKDIANRISRSLRTISTGGSRPPTATGQSASESVASIAPSTSTVEDDGKSRSVWGDRSSFGSNDLLLLRQIPLSYEKSRTYAKPEQLGSLAKADALSDGGMRPISLVSPADEREKILVSEILGNHDRVYLEWPPNLVDNYFDLNEYESVDEPADSVLRSPFKNKTKTVLDCIDKFCHKEQLEETEQWYCNKCQKHVQAWKQFHLYKSPPHLIVHLKRFHYSPTTHRRNKINLMIDFPLVGLDLSEHVSHYGDNDKPIYDCYAVTNHFGGLGGGHYTAYALNPDGVWCLYDDSRITSHVDPKEVVSQAAYVLYYRRRDVPVGEEYNLNIQTSHPHAIGTAVVVAASPAIIQNDTETKSQSPSSDISSGASASSNAAMIGDDDDDDAMDDIMNNDGNGDDLTDEENISSRGTSPMNSVLDGNDDEPSNLFFVEHDYDDDSRHQDDHANNYQSTSSKSTHMKRNSNGRGGGSHQLPLQ